MQSLYNSYKASPSADTLQKIENMIQATNQELPELLQAAHISDPALSARITAAVNLILTTVSSFASLIPQAAAAAPKTARRNTVIPQPKDLKRQWNQQVCLPAEMLRSMPRSACESCGNQKRESRKQYSLAPESEAFLMTLPVIVITNASTCLTDKQVSAVIPAMQRQVSLDFKAYWDLDCQLSFLAQHEPLPEGWWQISVMDNPDQAGALGYHEMSSRGTPLGKVFAGLDLQSGGSWTVTLSHELLEMLVDPWINWCAQGSDEKVYALEVCDAVEADGLGYESDGVLVSDFITPSWFEPTEADRVDFKRRIAKPFELASLRNCWGQHS